VKTDSASSGVAETGATESSASERSAAERLQSELVRRAQQGDANAFAALFHAHKAHIYALCLRMTTNVAEADDLTRDVFLQVFRKLPSFRGDCALSSCLRDIAVKMSLMRLRTNCRPTFHSQVIAEESVSPQYEGRLAVDF